MNISVTGLINNYKKFEKDFWLSYKTLERLLSPEKFNAIKLTLLKSKRIDERYINCVGVENFETERQLIDAEWTEKRNEAKAEGTAVHEQIQAMITNRDPKVSVFGIDPDQLTVMKTDQFLNCEKGVFPEFRMEYKLDDDYTLVGVADLIVKEGNALTVYDWKTAEKISSKSRYDVGNKRKKTFKYPISNIEDTELAQYQLQLSAYAWLLKKMNPEFEIKLEVVQIANYVPKQRIPVQYLESDITRLIDWHVHDLHLKAELEKCNPIKYE